MADFLELKTEVIKKAQGSLKFRKELKEDPKGAIEKHFKHLAEEGQEEIPRKINIVVCEDNDTTIYINVTPIQTS